jgi:hypothetical protein
MEATSRIAAHKSRPEPRPLEVRICFSEHFKDYDIQIWSGGKYWLELGHYYAKKSDALRAIRRLGRGLQEAIVVEEVNGRKIKKSLLPQSTKGIE